MKPICIVLLVVGAMAIGHGQRGKQSQRTPNGDAVQLPPGYHHASVGGVDSVGGRIWKDGGPDIHYEISLIAGDNARAYAQKDPKVSLIVARSPETGEIVVALDENHDARVVSIDRHAHYNARNIRTRKDVVEAMLIANSGSK